jgi:hypothetical protein
MHYFLIINTNILANFGDIGTFGDIAPPPFVLGAYIAGSFLPNCVGFFGDFFGDRSVTPLWILPPIKMLCFGRWHLFKTKPLFVLHQSQRSLDERFHIVVRERSPKKTISCILFLGNFSSKIIEFKKK